MKHLKILALLLLAVIACEKEDTRPLEFYDKVVYPNGYVFPTKQDSVNIVIMVKAPFQVNHPYNTENYISELALDPQFKSIKKTISAIDKLLPNVYLNVSFYNVKISTVDSHDVCYYRVRRVRDNKMTEVRSINFNWAKQ